MARNDNDDKKFALSEIMAKVHALTEYVWPDATPQEALLLIIDIQEAAAKALGLPEGLPLMTGDAADLD